jgi:hypothetical protein
MTNNSDNCGTGTGDWDEWESRTEESKSLLEEKDGNFFVVDKFYGVSRLPTRMFCWMKNGGGRKFLEGTAGTWNGANECF